MTTNRPLQVFLCHSSADKPAVRELYQKLRAEPWIDPWLDEEELFPGMDWNLEIEKAIEATDVILVCLSNNSITKEGYVQREIRIALDYADYKPEGTLFIIPVRLEECIPPKRLARWQYADYFKSQRENGLKRLIISLKKRSKSLGLDMDVKDVFSLIPSKREEKIIVGDTLGEVVSQWEEHFLKENNNPKSGPEVSLDKITFSNGMEFMRVPAGVFLMGSKNDSKFSYSDERPQHNVNIPYDYWISRFLVTNEGYNTYIESKKLKHPVLGWENRKDHPVSHIEWIDARAYCEWLNEILRSEFSSNLILRLPTEAEWEKASRGTDGRDYPWGEKFVQNVSNINSREGTTPVGFYSPDGDSPYGCADMTGNVWEWTHSLKKEYPYQPSDGREKEDFFSRHILRGGSYFSDEGLARCAYRGDFTLSSFDYYVGIRVVLSHKIS